jgi:type II secretory pathway pseudopilin PulG
MTNTPPPRRRSLCRLRASAPAFSLVETLVTVGLIALIVAVVIPRFGDVKTEVERAKLESDVAVLNEAVGLYVAEGGNLDDAASPQEVLDRLKTRSRDEDARRHVGPVTGRLVDPRLTARILTSSEAQSDAPRAIWSPTHRKFIIATRGNGVAAVYFDDEKAGLPIEQESRKPSNVQYNGGNGWVWEWQEQSEPAPASPPRCSWRGSPRRWPRAAAGPSGR